MKAILIDDEQPNLDNLQALLHHYCPQVTVCATALDAEAGKTLLYQHQPDLVFLDIQMPGQTGFDLLRSLPVYDFELIIVTAYDQYAIQALRFAAVDYLLKPIDIGELQAAVDKAIKQRRLKVQNQQLEHLMQLLQAQQTNEEPRMALATAKETRLVKVGDIIRCESSNNYTTFFLSDGEALLVCKPIYEYEASLKAYGFLRCHQSHLVNRTWIRSWKKEFGDFLRLTDGTDVPISRGKKEAIRQALNLS
ncbi:two component transcriptional regulator, LytTR family [Fibrella aestuarina BUZ 2]|uniref:Two component transcriptional regulator, LytTR family n=1 Tax=Fibrella aestuarina BUZ 2 TaxID=1166018 RepID=I0K9P7_9BACT|nr:LytTR family DNA-binding domain-containing protein [Fibrella aestuarina]CCH00850.1 two component transcriptional regulator, LytTR family [Fibrella aestuarina BUZ 2]